MVGVCHQHCQRIAEHRRCLLERNFMIFQIARSLRGIPFKFIAHVRKVTNSRNGANWSTPKYATTVARFALTRISLQRSSKTRPAKVSRHLPLRLEKLPKAIQAISWKAQG